MLSCSDEVPPPTSSLGGFSAAGFPNPLVLQAWPNLPLSAFLAPSPHRRDKGLGMGSVGIQPMASRASLQPSLP